MHKRWLPPSVVALLCTRLGLDQEPDFSPIRSERHHPYLAFLHYLALAADLIGVTPSALQLTPTAWLWLNADAATRQQQLETAWFTAPLALAQRFPFRWEPLSPRTRAFVSERLATLAAGQQIPLAELVQQWRLLDSTGLLPGPRPDDWRDEVTLYDPLVALIRGALHWLGLVELTMDDGALYASRPLSVARPPAALCIMPKQPVNTILAPLTALPVHLVQLAPFCDWTVATAPTATPHTFTLAPDRMAQLAAAGITATEIFEAITAALGRQPSRRLVQRIRTWLKPGQQLAIRPLVVLEADTPERLAQLRRHKLVRNRLGAVIAPNRMALNPDDAPALAQTLRTLGYYVEPPAPSSPPPELVEGDGKDGGLTLEVQWFLLTLYQGLGKQIPLPMTPPRAARQAIRQQLTQQQQAAAEAAANNTLERLQAALNGYLQIPAWSMPATADAAPVIQAALDQGHDIEIRYWGPGDGHVTTRTVTPYWIEARHDISYLIGWCHLRQQERTFRIDRIEAVRVVAGR
ncbi:MAG: WYL domain-containing protein [Caldilineaceae bacterium]